MACCLRLGFGDAWLRWDSQACLSLGSREGLTAAGAPGAFAHGFVRRLVDSHCEPKLGMIHQPAIGKYSQWNRRFGPSFSQRFHGPAASYRAFAKDGWQLFDRNGGASVSC